MKKSAVVSIIQRVLFSALNRGRTQPGGNSRCSMKFDAIDGVDEPFVVLYDCVTGEVWTDDSGGGS